MIRKFIFFIVLLAIPSASAVSPDLSNARLDSETTADDWNVTWYNTRDDMTQEYIIGIQNLNPTTHRDFNLSVLISEVSFTGDILINKFSEWKNLSNNRTVDLYENQTEYINITNESIPDKCWGYNATHIACNSTVYIGSYQVPEYQLDWKPTKNQIIKSKVNNKYQEHVGMINIPKYNSKEKDATVNGTKWFNLIFTPPIHEINGGWGSSGKVAISDGGTIFHPWWNNTYLCRRLVQNAASSARFPSLVNLSNDLFYVENATSGETIYAYFRNVDCTGDVAFGNSSAQVCWENSTSPQSGGYCASSVWDSNFQVVYHLDDGTGLLDSTGNYDGDFIHGTPVSVDAQVGTGLNFSSEGINVSNLRISSQATGTFLLRIRPEAMPNSDAIDSPGNDQLIRVEQANGEGIKISWALATSNDIGVFVGTLSTDRFYTPNDPALVVDTEYCVGVRWNGTFWSLWEAGVQKAVSVSDASSPAPANSEWITIFSAEDATRFFVGTGDEVMLLDTNLSDAEMADYCNLETLITLGDADTIPTITIDSPDNTTYSSIIIDLNVSADEPITTWTYEYNGNGTNITFTPNTTFMATGGDGNKNITVYGNDSTGNVNSSIVYFTLATIPPTITIDSPDNTTYSSIIIDLNVSADEPITTWTYEYNGNGTNITFTPNTTFMATGGDGNKNITVYGNDTAGSINSSTAYFSLDTSIPNIMINNPENITYNNTNLSFHANSTEPFPDTWQFWIESGGTNITQNISYVEDSNISIKNYLTGEGTYELHVWLNDTSGNENTTFVTFTINLTANITYNPTTPPSGGGGGYTITPTFDFIANTTIEAFEPFTVEANITIDGITSFSDPTIYVQRENIFFGTFVMVYESGEDDSQVWWITIDTLAPGNYTYFIEILGSNGVYYYSPKNSLTVIEPLTREATGEGTLPGGDHLLVALISPPTPLSHDSIGLSGFTAEARAYNVNGSITQAFLFFLTTQGEFVSNVSLDVSDAGNNSWLVYGQATPPTGYSTLSINVGIEDTTGRTGSSITRLIRVVTTNSDAPIAAGLRTIEGTIGTSRGSPEQPFGKVFLGLMFIAMLVAAVIKSPLGVAGAAPMLIIGVILEAQGGELPSYLGILAVIATAILAIILIIKILPKGGESV